MTFGLFYEGKLILEHGCQLIEDVEEIVGGFEVGEILHKIMCKS